MTIRVATFQPIPGASTKALNPIVTSARVQVLAAGDNLNTDLLVVNASSLPVAIAIGDVTVVSVLPIVGTPGNMVIAAGSTQTVDLSEALSLNAACYVAVIASGTATGNIYLTPGIGSR